MEEEGEEGPSPRRWCACFVLSVSVLLCMSTWLSTGVVLGYLTRHLGIGDGDAALLTVGVQSILPPEIFSPRWRYYTKLSFRPWRTNASAAWL